MERVALVPPNEAVEEGVHGPGVPGDEERGDGPAKDELCFFVGSVGRGDVLFGPPFYDRVQIIKIIVI